ncbi:alpha-ketoacid dehydrogenase subunit beta [Paenibacillus sp. PsM32]|uniref:Alpha-ketoacid dehydrogenase subunit beta n=1 Tax=Paenibacillus kyungheensis TaxID=1452732 RepID=A0AAX3LWZ5_9BACL|nr:MULTISPECIES: alpha-ketoacid dehydrogenase subunit beta [Paenibacillus]MDN4619680.1 alpha-ketoacid dehydrogenase subunit beta [Paenibacillus sp. PsM32]MDQ1234801.1 2-oxoisovalerate dehydrogenase E1 component beta subunit [Paenibacillus sp. SORGH_AS_0306]MDR6111848.1 2-oxoisovalerate dehydrogenase E1 component beta subunit [Paenibacillus sp. SORGH_AS_0338]WCT54387.1 alpha-ketoacid dehydrogenase subunit beta [Paenibacillus kyungheensis]WDF52486.1 alpha-ketoacid dehydrogenase subunit beta [Pae
MAMMEYIDAIRLAMKEEMALDDNVFVLGEDVGLKGGVFTTTKGLQEQFGEDRVMDTPLAESAIAGVAIGAAMYGMKPIAEMQYSDFMLPATNQIISEAAKIRYRSNNDWSCPLVVRAPIGGGVFGGLYHSQCMESVFFGTAGLKIVAPYSAYDAKGLLKAAVRDPDPVLFFENKKCYKLIKGDVPDDDYVVPIGEANLLRSGDDITVISYSLPLHFIMQAAEELEQEDGITSHVLDLRTIQPLDRQAIIDAARHTGKVLIVHEDNLTGGVGGEVAAIIAEECLFELDAPIRRLAGPDTPPMPINPPQEKFFMLNKDKVKTAMRDLALF